MTVPELIQQLVNDMAAQTGMSSVGADTIEELAEEVMAGDDSWTEQDIALMRTILSAGGMLRAKPMNVKG